MEGNLLIRKWAQGWRQGLALAFLAALIEAVEAQEKAGAAQD